MVANIVDIGTPDDVATDVRGRARD
jgi:hypothetical protein